MTSVAGASRVDTEPTADRSPTAVSLFSGCGGFCEGVTLAGFKIVAAVEKDPSAAATYRRNNPDVPLFEGDIKHFLHPERRAWREAAESFTTVRRGKVDLVFGGPPCQGFSQIGPRDAEDPRNSLYREFVRVVKSLQPSFFIMENVPNMLRLADGHFESKVVSAFKRAGYARVAHRVLDASEFGVPQARRRLFFFGSKSKIDLDDKIDSCLKAQRRRKYSVIQAIGDLPATVGEPAETLAYPLNRKHNKLLDELRLDRSGAFYTTKQKASMAGGMVLHNHHTKGIEARRLRLIKRLKPGLRGDSLPRAYRNTVRPHKWRRLAPNRPSHTILAQMHRDLSEWVHPVHDRWITVREAARLQSFHDGFVFETSEYQMLKQVGNAVPPLLGRAVARVAMSTLH